MICLIPNMTKIRYRIIADILFFIHFGWLLMLAVSAVYILYNRDFVVKHLIIVSGTLLLNLPFGGRCPLTIWEGKFRKLWNPDADFHFDSFFATYVRKFFRINITPRQANIFLTIVKVSSYGIAVLILTKVI